MLRTTALFCISLLALSVYANADEAPFAPIVDTPGLPRVLLIGDSISVGYTLPTRALLQGKVNLHRIPQNGASTLRGLEMIDVWLGDSKWDVIHFNWGLHDIKHEKDGKHDKSFPCMVPLADYEKNLETLVARLEKTGAKLIWATTTMVPEGEPRRVPEDLPAYKEAALRVMAAHNIPVDDLYAVSITECADQHKAAGDVHYTEEGYKRFAARVAEHITDALKSATAPAN